MNKKINVIILLFAVFFLIGCDTYIISPLMPIIGQDLNIKTGSIGHLVTMYSISYVICSPILGPVSDKIGRKKMIVIGMCMFALASIATGLSKTFMLMLIFRVMTGVGAAFAAPNVWAYIGDYFDYSERGKVTASIASALSLGMILGVPLGSFLAKLLSWHGTFYVLGILALIVCLSVFVIFNDIKVNNKKQQNYLNTFKIILKERNIDFSFITTLLISFSNFGLYTFLGYWINKCFNFNVSQIGEFMIIGGIGNLAGIQIGGNLGDNFGKRKVAAWSLIIMSVMLIILPLLKNSILLTGIVIFLWLAAGGAAFSNMQVFVTALKNEVRGTIMALNNSFMWAGTALGSVIVGLAIDNKGFISGTIICAVAAVMAFIILKFLINEENS